MSMQRKLKRNIEKQSNDFLKQHRKELPSDWLARPQEERTLLAMMARNGITQEDMKREISRVKRETYELTSVATLKIAYAAIGLVLADEFGFSHDECMKALKEIDHKISTSIDDEEILSEMENKVGIRFNSQDGIARIESI